LKKMKSKSVFIQTFKKGKQLFEYQHFLLLRDIRW
jgi:hypothetical protein